MGSLSLSAIYTESLGNCFLRFESVIAYLCLLPEKSGCTSMSSLHQSAWSPDHTLSRFSRNSWRKFQVYIIHNNWKSFFLSRCRSFFCLRPLLMQHIAHSLRCRYLLVAMALKVLHKPAVEEWRNHSCTHHTNAEIYVYPPTLYYTYVDLIGTYLLKKKKIMKTLDSSCGRSIRPICLFFSFFFKLKVSMRR